MTKLADKFNALGNPHRYQIMCELLRNPQLTSGQIAGEIHLSPSATSQHLTHLRNAGLVNTERNGVVIWYSANYGFSVNDQLFSIIGETMRYD